MLRFVVCLLIALGLAAEDPGICQITKLSTGGIFSSPKFSFDGRFVLAVAREGPFGKCDHVYRFDRSPNPQPISLVSTGVGWENSISLRDSVADGGQLYSIASSAAKDWRRLTQQRYAAANEAFFCPPTKCGPLSEPEVEDACNAAHIERFEGTLSVDFYQSFSPMPMQRDRRTVWKSAKAGHQRWSIYSEKKKPGSGESIVLEVDDDENDVKSETHWSDGFVWDDHGSGLRALYAGAHATENQLLAIDRGVVPLRGAKIYQLSGFNLEPADAQERVLIGDPNFSFVAPSVSAALPGVVLATRIDAKERHQLIRWEKGKITVLTDAATNSRFGQLSPDGKYVTFVSDRDGQRDQLYVATLGRIALSDPNFITRPPMTTMGLSAHISDVVVYSSSPSYTSWIRPGHRRPVVTAKAETVMYSTTTEEWCDEIHQLRLDRRDGYVRRKLSSGLLAATAPNFLGDADAADVLMAATLTRDFATDRGKEAAPCREGTCALPKSPRMAELCKSHSPYVRTLPRDSELLIVDQYGLLKSRLTANDVWDGEAKVSADKQSLIFGKRSGDGYELRWMRLTLTDNRALNLPRGPNFAFDVDFCPDAPLIAYAAYRPNTAALKQRFADLLPFDTVDPVYADIFVYDLETDVERKVDDCGKAGSYCRAPVFVPGTRQIVYMVTGKDQKDTWLKVWDLDRERGVMLDRIAHEADTDQLFFRNRTRLQILHTKHDQIAVGEFSFVPKRRIPPPPSGKPTKPMEAPPPDATTQTSRAQRLAVMMAVLPIFLWIYNVFR